MIGRLTDSEIEDVLRRGRVGRIACSVDDQPYIVPVTYVYESGMVYALSTLGRKIAMMRQQPNVCFEVEEIDQPSNWRCVIADAQYEEFTDWPARTEVVHRIASLGGPVLPVPTNGQVAVADALVVFRLRLTDVSGRFSRRDA